MHKNDCFSLGYITKLHGYKGALVFFLDVDNPQEYSKLESVFIELDNKLIPFFISKIEFKPGSNNAVVTLKDISSSEQASKLIKKELFLPVSFLPKLDGNKFYFHEIIGFTVASEEHGEIGIVGKVIDLPNNPLLSVITPSKQEVLIPVIDEFVESVNRNEKILRVSLPEGLIDLYLSE